MDNIYVDLINGEIPAIPFATRKIFHFDLNIDKTKIPANQETPATDDNIDEKIASDNFITPSEYYNKNSEGTHGSAEKDKQGYYNANGTNTNIEIGKYVQAIISTFDKLNISEKTKDKTFI